jgi:hypothetical protein
MCKGRRHENASGSRFHQSVENAHVVMKTDPEESPSIIGNPPPESMTASTKTPT